MHVNWASNDPLTAGVIARPVQKAGFGSPRLWEDCNALGSMPGDRTAAAQASWAFQDVQSPESEAL
jgi:hypothetical protein